MDQGFRYIPWVHVTFDTRLEITQLYSVSRQKVPMNEFLVYVEMSFARADFSAIVASHSLALSVKERHMSYLPPGFGLAEVSLCRSEVTFT